MTTENLTNEQVNVQDACFVKPQLFHENYEVHMELLFKISSGIPIEEVIRDYKITSKDDEGNDLNHYLYAIVRGLPMELLVEKYTVCKN